MSCHANSIETRLDKINPKKWRNPFLTMRFKNSFRCFLVFNLLGYDYTSGFTLQSSRNPYEKMKELRFQQTMTSVGSSTAALVTEKVAMTQEEESVEFPPPLSTVDRLKRAATFWSVAIPIVANYYGKFAEMKLREGLLGETMSEEEIEVGKTL
jgi:hypothetical protein